MEVSGDISTFLLLLSLCWKTPWQIVCGGVTYPRLEWTGQEHASHSASTTPHSYFGQRMRRAAFPIESAGGWMCASNPLVPALLGPGTRGRAVMNPLLRIAHSGGNVITESSGLEKTSWGHLVPSGHLNGIPASTLPEQSCLLTTPIPHTHPLCILSLFSLLSFREIAY